MKGLINIGIAEDHGLLRHGLVSLLKPHKNIKIHFAVSNGQELLDELKNIRLDILLLDLEMPIMRGQEVLEKINKKYPKIKVIIVSGFFQKDYIIECFKLGVRAFLPKDDKIETVLEAIYSVHEKGIFSDPAVTMILATEIHNSNNNSIPKKIAFSDAEKKVLKLVCKGNSRRMAAEILNVKPETVHYHMSNIMRKTGIHKTPVLIKYVLDNKLISL